MRPVYQSSLLFIRIVLFVHVTTTMAFAQNFATGNATPAAPAQEENAATDEELDAEDKAQIEKKMTAEELKKPISTEGLILGEDAEVLASEISSEYTLGFQDVIEVTVLRHDEVSGQYPINAEGAIQYGFVGDLKVAGMKKDEVKQVLTDKLSHYIINPEVTVTIIGYNSKIVYVVGEVGNPGKIAMRGDTITVREALVQAGLPLLSGKLKSAKLITPDDTGKADVRGVNVHKLLYQGDLRENLVMVPGDTLYIPPTFLAKTMRVIQPVAAPLNTAGGAARQVYTHGF